MVNLNNKVKGIICVLIAAFGFSVMSLFVKLSGDLPAFQKAFFRTLGLLCNFYALGRLNLSDANMLNKLSPFFAILFSVILLKEKPGIVQLLGVAVAFIGSVFIIKPGFNSPSAVPALAGVSSVSAVYDGGV